MKRGKRSEVGAPKHKHLVENSKSLTQSLKQDMPESSGLGQLPTLRGKTRENVSVWLFIWLTPNNSRERYTLEAEAEW